MTGRTITVAAEWALRGKTPSDRGYRILGCSHGDLRRQNFEEALDRFSPGTLEVLPQVSVSYLTRADQIGGSYVTLAVRELAEGHRDAMGREVIVTRYFCVPYDQLAGDAITYMAMYDAFRALRLPASDGPPLAAEIAVAPVQIPPIGDLAYQVAALLLDGPVCVLGADRTSVEDRLRFIDAVMSLLPYGMRSRMSASTWTSSTYQTHRFRLFFSDAPRAPKGTDYAVAWGRPERTDLPEARRPVDDYLGWLQATVQQPVLRLAQMTGELGFGSAPVVRMLEQVGATGSYPAQPRPGGSPDHAAPADMLPRTPVEAILLDCVSAIADGRLTELKSSISALREHAADLIADEDRERCQELIRRHQLLRPGLAIGRFDGKFYDALLRIAFGTPLTYEGYCGLERCAEKPLTEMPHLPLLRAIEHGGMGDIRVAAIVLRYLGDKKLSNWFQSRETDIADLITWLAGPWDQPHHARIVCDVTVQFLREAPGSYDRQSVLAVLRDHGYLAQALQLRYSDLPQYQVDTLSYFLLAAYGGSLDRSVAEDILTGTRYPPTPALLTAVLLQLMNPEEDAATAEKAYLAGQIRLTGFDPRTRARLERFIPGSRRAGPQGGDGLAAGFSRRRRTW